MGRGQTTRRREIVRTAASRGVSARTRARIEQGIVWQLEHLDELTRAEELTTPPAPRLMLPDTGMRIEALGPRDLRSCMRLEATAPRALHWPTVFWRYELAQHEGARYWGVRSGRSLVGYIGTWLLPENDVAPRRVAVADIVIAAERRGQGLGGLLLAHGLLEGTRAGATRALLTVATDNTSARALYARFGFDERAVWRGYYRDSDALVLAVDGIDTPEYRGALERALAPAEERAAA